jgi:hypothetical protein
VLVVNVHHAHLASCWGTGRQSFGALDLRLDLRPQSFGALDLRPQSFGALDLRPQSFGALNLRPQSFGALDLRPQSFGALDLRPQSFGALDPSCWGTGPQSSIGSIEALLRHW